MKGDRHRKRINDTLPHSPYISRERTESSGAQNGMNGLAIGWRDGWTSGMAAAAVKKAKAK